MVEAATWPFQMYDHQSPHCCTLHSTLVPLTLQPVPPDTTHWRHHTRWPLHTAAIAPLLVACVVSCTSQSTLSAPCTPAASSLLRVPLLPPLPALHCRHVLVVQRRQELDDVLGSRSTNHRESTQGPLTAAPLVHYQDCCLLRPSSHLHSSSLTVHSVGQAGKTVVKLNETYKLDLEKMIQFRIDDPNRWRNIRRQPPASKGKQAAGGDDVEDAEQEDEEEEEEEAKQADDDEDEEYVDEEEDEAPRNKNAKKQAAEKKQPTKQPSKQPTQPTAVPTAAPVAAKPATGGGDNKRVAELEEEKKKIIADYETEIETMQTDMQTKREDYERRIKRLESEVDGAQEVRSRLVGKENELKELQRELNELRQEHETLISHLSPALQILAKRGARGEAGSKGKADAAGGGASVGEKRPRDSSTSSTSASASNKRSHQPDNEQQPTQLVTQTLALDDADMNLFAVHTPALSLHAVPSAFQAVLDRHLINPATLSHTLRPICCHPSIGNELLVGYTHGRIELYDGGNYKLLTTVQEDNERVKSGADSSGDIDDEWRGESGNVYCITSYTASGGQRMVVAGRGRRLMLYERSGGAASGHSSVTMREVRTFDTGRGGFVSAVCVTREGWLAVGVSGNTNCLKIFDLEHTGDWQPLHTLRTKSSEVRRIVQLNDDRLAVAVCSSLQRPTDKEESGAVELWRVERGGCERQLPQDGPTVDARVGLRCNSITLLNPGQGRDSQLAAAYEFCSSGDRMIRLHNITHTSSSTTIIEVQNAPHPTENTYTGLVAYGSGCVFGLTYGGKLLQWQRGKDGKWAQMGKGVKAEEEMEVDESGGVACLSDGRLVVTGGKGSIKLWR